VSVPIYFGRVAPNCPISQDSPQGLYNRSIRQRTVIPRATDLSSAIIAANLARFIVTSTVTDLVRNNVKQQPGGGKSVIQPDKFKNKTSRWSLQKNLTVKKKYKYFGKDAEGNKNLLTYVTMERIERMVWYDKAWKSYLIWDYGDKGEGDEVGSDGLTPEERAMKDSGG
jgi:hypothetical protein